MEEIIVGEIERHEFFANFYYFFWTTNNFIFFEYFLFENY